MNKIQAVFFDRDGTLGQRANVEFPTDFEPFPDVKEVFSKIKALGIKVFIFTNQSCIARKKDFGYDFVKEFILYGADDWFICPHDNADNCNCRKPKSGLLLDAQKKHKLDLTQCVVVGDRWTDIQSGLNVGAKTILVRSGRGRESEISEDAKKYIKLTDCICDNLQEVLKTVIRLNK